MPDPTRVTTVWHEHTGKRTLIATVQTEKITDFDTQALETEFKEVTPTCGHRLAVDMSKVQLLGSSGLAFLIWLKKRCASSHGAGGAAGRVVFFGFTDEILGMLKVTRLHSMLEIAGDRKSALALL